MCKTPYVATAKAGESVAGTGSKKDKKYIYSHPLPACVLGNYLRLSVCSLITVHRKSSDVKTDSSSTVPST